VKETKIGSVFTSSGLVVFEDFGGITFTLFIYFLPVFIAVALRF